MKKFVVYESLYKNRKTDNIQQICNQSQNEDIPDPEKANCILGLLQL